MDDRGGEMENLVRSSGFWRGKRVLITGHTGFKGSWLTLILHRLGAEVAGYADAVPTEPSHFELSRIGTALSADYRHDIRDLPSLISSCRDFKPDILFHMAAQPLVRVSLAAPIDTFDINVTGTVNCLEAIRAEPSVRAAVIVTSDKVYADRNWDFGYRETDTLGGADPYSASKACAELVVASYRQSFTLDGRGAGAVISSARAGNVVGGGDFSADRLLPDLVRSIKSRQTLVLRYPEATRPWQHVVDPLLGYMRLAEALFLGQTHDSGWNFGPVASRPVTVGQFVQRFADAWGEGPFPVAMAGSSQPKEMGMLQVDSTKAAIRLGWHPAISFDRTLSLTAQWYRAYRDCKDVSEISRRQVDEILSSTKMQG